jgi:hypothetical protein
MPLFLSTITGLIAATHVLCQSLFLKYEWQKFSRDIKQDKTLLAGERTPKLRQDALCWGLNPKTAAAMMQALQCSVHGFVTQG